MLLTSQNFNKSCRARRERSWAVAGSWNGCITSRCRAIRCSAVPICEPNTDGSGFFFLAQVRISVQASGATSTSRSELKSSDASPDEAMVDSLLLCRVITIWIVVILEEKRFLGQ